MNLQPINQYLGDGVYARFDGYMLTIRLNAHDSNDSVIALDSEVLVALNEFAMTSQIAMKSRVQELNKTAGQPACEAVGLTPQDACQSDEVDDAGKL